MCNGLGAEAYAFPPSDVGCGCKPNPGVRNGYGSAEQSVFKEAARVRCTLNETMHYL